MRAICLLLCATCWGSDPEPVTVCLTQLWEVYEYDYDYMDDDGAYAELATCAWTVEVRSDLPNGMTGWTYVGFVQLTKIIRYDSDEDEAEAWWSARLGKTGSAATTEDAVRRILEHRGPVGRIDIKWR